MNGYGRVCVTVAATLCSIPSTAQAAEGTAGARTPAEWIEAGSRTYRFQVGDAAPVFLHGHPVALADLRPGDHVGVLYPTAQEGLPLVHAVQVRAQRLPQP